MCAMASMSGTKPESKWLAFDGSAERGIMTAILRPTIDGRVELELRNEDVRTDPGGPYVRQGARALRIDIPLDSPIRHATAPPSSPDACDGYPTTCVGNVLFCCHTYDIEDSCYGYWSCP